jgi:cell division protein FtsQ
LKIVSENELINLSGLSPGANIFEINEQFYEKAVEIHPMVKSAKVIRHLPGEIEIKVEERKVWALIPHENVFLCIDEEGICIDRLKHYSLFDYPIITMDSMPERVNLGQAIDPEGIQEIRKIWNTISKESQAEISDFHYINASKEVVIYTKKGTQVWFGNSERLDQKVNVFNQVFQMENKFEEEGTVLEYIDLRFSGQPVVKTRI